VTKRKEGIPTGPALSKVLKDLAVSALPGVDSRYDHEWLGMSRKVTSDPDAAERFRREYIGEWASTAPPPMRSCRQLVVPWGVLIHGERGSGRTHTLLDILRERRDHAKRGDVRPFLFVYLPSRRMFMRDTAIDRGFANDARLFATPAEVEGARGRGLQFDGLLVDGWAEFSDRERSFLLALAPRQTIRYWTL
jgi:hypothetical protein